MEKSSNHSQGTPSPPDLSRRRAFKLLGAAGISSLLLGTAGVVATNNAHKSAIKIKTKANILIVGAGAAGLSAASRLSAQLDGANITIIDKRKDHYYQPGFTLIASGIKAKNYSVSLTAEYVPDDIELIEDSVVEFDPDSNKVTTENGKVLTYDYLIVATGLKLDYAAIDGMDESLIGKNGLGSIYHGPEAAFATWQLMSAFADKGDIGVFQRPNTEIKCAGAPLKYTFVTEDYLTRRGTRSKSEVIYNSNNQALFSVPIVSEKVRMLFQQRNIITNYNRELKALDLTKRIATFSSPDGNVELAYDFINVVPPMRAPDSVRNSPLSWQSGIYAADGWMEVDKSTLRHIRYPNVFGIGDVAGVPKGKTAASVKWQVPVAVDHLIGSITGKPSEEIYNGYTSCPLITGLGQAMLVEFDYDNNLTPSFPGMIAPLEELWTSWVMKTMGLKPTYISMLRGQA